MVGRRTKKHRISGLHSFSCGSESFKGEHSLIGEPGFSRLVYCNDTESYEDTVLGYGGNYVRTTKYSLLSFFPKSLYEQFRRIANVFFLFCAILSFTPLSPYSAVSSVVPLVVVVGVTMGKEAVEDLRRKTQDTEVNNRKVQLHSSEKGFNLATWWSLKVGNVVKVEKDDFFPADLILLSSSNDDGTCYVETSNLDGETNLKVKKALDGTSTFTEDSNFRDFKAIIRCEDPNANLYSFVGSLELGEQLFALSPQQLLLRDSRLRNTDHIYGVVIFTGHDTKVMQNSTPPPSKRSKIEKRMDKIVYLLFFILVFMSVAGSIYFGLTTYEDIEDGKMTRWYLRPDETTIYYDPERPVAAAILNFFTAVMLYSYLIPISLYVSIEIVKVLQSVFINQDQVMYYEKADQPAQARTSNLNEELGQVETILSDKTGTLTCNSMEFIKCSVAGTSYGHGVTEVERALARRKGMGLLQDDTLSGVQYEATEGVCSVKGFNFVDERIMDGKWAYEPRADIIQKFFRLLAICHTVIPEVDEESGRVSYEAESPDEAAFVIAAREIGFEFCERTQSSILVHEFDPSSRKQIERGYELLTTIEFSSFRKRMSVIVRDENGKIFLLSKGADSVMFRRLAEHGKEFEHKVQDHIREYADAGLRTLVLAYREIDEDEYKEFNNEFTRARNSLRPNREELIEDAADKIERNLVLLGATAVEDKLQHGVPECIDKLALAGIKIWVLTGDKMETAINIGFACSLLRQGMNQIIISSETAEAISFEKMEQGTASSEALKQCVLRQLNEGRDVIAASDENTEAYALIIDGKSLVHALQPDVADLFLEIAIRCASVICCRSSPKQKALVTRLVKKKTGGTTLAIGDGANDVGMLQEADIGVGISGVEGMQAVMSSDIAIAQFRFLERLLLVHGHWCYRRISSMICYFFYKNIVFGCTIFFYEAYASFSGQPAYNDWFLSLYNVFFTALPVISQGVFDQDVSSSFCFKFPVLYQEGIQNVLFSWFRIISWAFNGFLSATTIFFLCIYSLENQAFRKNGKVVGLEILGATMYTCIVCVVNCQMALFINYFTYIQHIVIWGGIAFWFVFLLGYGAMDPSISTSAYLVFAEACAPAPSYWFTILFVTISTLLPYFIFSAIQMRFFPLYHQMIQLVRRDGQTEDPEFCDLLRQSSMGPTTVGCSARMEAALKLVQEET